MKHISLFFVLLLLSACVIAPTQRAHHIQITSADKIKSCEFLGGIFGESYFAYLAVGIDDAKNKALDKAAFLQATHVVWTRVEATAKPYAYGRAYRCK